MNRILTFIGFFCVSSCYLAGYAQSNKDTLIFANGDVIIGEIKSLDRGVVTIETDYSDKDFVIEWKKLKNIKSGSRFLITLRNGFRINGTIHPLDKSDSIYLSGKRVYSQIEEQMATKVNDIVYLKGLEEKFLSRLNASIDFGLNLTRANNLKQYNSKASVGYLADDWAADGYFQFLRSVQDSVTPTKRTDAGLTYNLYLPKDWFLTGSLNFLSNTEQAIQLRTTGKIGGGKFLLHTNRRYWTAGGGLSLNNEDFSNEVASRKSLEVFAATEINLFDIGDLNLLSNIFLYRSITEKNRWRSDIKLDLKYDLPLDFYIKFGTTLNYDNQPAISGRETDYIINFGFGWEL